jgi:hypothetical protein
MNAIQQRSAIAKLFSNQRTPVQTNKIMVAFRNHIQHHANRFDMSYLRSLFQPVIKWVVHNSPTVSGSLWQAPRRICAEVVDVHDCWGYSSADYLWESDIPELPSSSRHGQVAGIPVSASIFLSHTLPYTHTKKKPILFQNSKYKDDLCQTSQSEMRTH